MKENGTFRKRTGYTITGNILARDKQLSLKAKGLYLLIMSYITCESFKLTKIFIKQNSIEGEKAFDSAWNELKNHGYLKVYFNRKERGQWDTEYELLDNPELGPHTFYLSSDGTVLSTNLDRQEKCKKEEVEVTPIAVAGEQELLAERKDNKQAEATPDDVRKNKEEESNGEKEREGAGEAVDHNGNTVINKNITEELASEFEVILPYPPKGGNGQFSEQDRRTPLDGSNGNGGYRDGGGRKGGNNVIPNNNTDINKIYSFTSFIHEGRNEMNEVKIEDIVKQEFYNVPVLEVPYRYKQEEAKMTIAIHLLTDWETCYKAGYKGDGHTGAYMLFNTALIEMCCSDTEMKLKGSIVTYSKVIDRINYLLSRHGPDADFNHYARYGEFVFRDFYCAVIDAFVSATLTRKITNYINYMKSIIWEYLITYETKFHAEFYRLGD